MDSPRVFQNGTVTAVAAVRGGQVHVGTHEMSCVREVSVSLNLETGESSVRLAFLRSPDPEVNRKIEEEIRTARLVPWVEVVD